MLRKEKSRGVSNFVQVELDGLLLSFGAATAPSVGACWADIILAVNEK